MSDRRGRARDWPDFEPLPEWMDRAACKGGNADWWFPHGWGRGQHKGIRQAKQVCWNQCPVRPECLEYAVTTRQKYGIWGGLTERQRRVVRKEWAA